MMVWPDCGSVASTAPVTVDFPRTQGCYQANAIHRRHCSVFDAEGRGKNATQNGGTKMPADNSWVDKTEL